MSSRIFIQIMTVWYANSPLRQCQMSKLECQNLHMDPRSDQHRVHYVIALFAWHVIGLICIICYHRSCVNANADIAIICLRAALYSDGHAQIHTNSQHTFIIQP